MAFAGSAAPDENGIPGNRFLVEALRKGAPGFAASAALSAAR
jgi:hypothetical protein